MRAKSTPACHQPTENAVADTSPDAAAYQPRTRLSALPRARAAARWQAPLAYTARDATQRAADSGGYGDAIVIVMLTRTP
jgi:hypothetical protein